ncbi:molybdopterin-dependent oxidoreductase [Pseudovibrio exalbescens]|uniref:xanthine dehydrogenase family protein molybdopterin-binding subunit n=1 Tax=Pseudovibrio exalbescens TaxID=197461 RepID=UPI00236694A2|nr:molybdopterin cofactor-binding domain-containing protein [Pseudovibrio exalbescens]MDD7911772.1 molybdopterin-dependent oxidoreductase [Pseudovibrio exalbescens]
MSKLGKITRRSFLGFAALAAGGVAIGYYFYQKPHANPLDARKAEGDAVFNPYVTISKEGEITIITPRAEMGQGTQTTLAALVAEELEVSLDQIKVEHGPASAAYYNSAMFMEGGPFAAFDTSLLAESARETMGVAAKFLGVQVTGGSSAMIDAFQKMREAGAAARTILVQAAAAQWDVAPEGLKAENGVITNPQSGESVSYAEVAATAAELTPPSDIKLKSPRDWKLLGKSQPRVELREKVTGAPIYGIDVELPEMLYATVRMSPRFGANVKTHDPAPALQIRGVEKVIPLSSRYGHGLAVIATNTWAAFKGADAIKVVWEEAEYPADTEGMRRRFMAALNQDASFSLGGSGDPKGVLSQTPEDRHLEVTYEVPFLAHATMEPMNATAQWRGETLEIWCPNQTPTMVRHVCASHFGIGGENIIVNTTHLGGGFGRRLEVDYALYAAIVAKETDGRPVKVTWTREEDTRHDAYRPMAVARYRGALTEQGNLSAVDVDVAVPPLFKKVVGRLFPDVPLAGPDKLLLEGAYDQPTTIENRRYAAHEVDLPIPIGFWRSVGNSYNGFFHESFIDEAAHKAGKDPLAFRLTMMNDEEHAPAKGVLRKVAEISEWGSPLSEGKGRGIAHTISFGTWVAQVVQVDVSDGYLTIEKVWCVADPGIVLDPANFKAQLISGAIFGLSQALGQEITFSNGEVEQSNFYDFDAMRMHQTPAFHIELLENSPHMGGAGEPGTPPAPAALANAIFAATGKRIRTMPLSKEIDFT